MKTKIKKKYRITKKSKFFLRHLRGSGKKKRKGGTKRKRSQLRSQTSSQTRGSLRSQGTFMAQPPQAVSVRTSRSRSQMRQSTQLQNKNKMSLKKKTVQNKGSMGITPNIEINKELYKQIQKKGGLLQLLLDMVGSSYNLAIFSGFLQEGTTFPYENIDGTKLYENKQSRKTDIDPYICESSGRTRCSSCNLPPNFEEGLLFDGAHWKGYRTKNGSTIVYDSYERNLQVKGTNNYCQSFATFLWTSEGNHNKKHKVTLLEGKYSKNIQVISCLWKKLFTEIQSNYNHFMWYVQQLNNDIDLPYFKKPKNKNSTIIFDILLRILQELCDNEHLASKFSSMRESNDSTELPELNAVFNL